MSSEDTILHEFSHAVYYRDTPEAERLGSAQEVTIAEVSAETIHRGLAREMIAKKSIDYTAEEYIAVTIAMPLQILSRMSDSSDPYYQAATYVLNPIFENGAAEFDGSRIKVRDKERIFSILKSNAEKVIALYRNPESGPQKAKSWIAENCVAGAKLQKLIDFIQAFGIGR